jgi:hypothetical protein
MLPQVKHRGAHDVSFRAPFGWAVHAPAIGTSGAAGTRW